MAFQPVFGKSFPNVFPTASAGDWWNLFGAIPKANCIAAYRAKGAASLAASYVNLVTPGTYDAAPGVAPTWDAVNGWKFVTTSSQYLTTGISGTLKPVTILARFTVSSVVAFRTILGATVNGGLGYLVAQTTGLLTLARVNLLNICQSSTGSGLTNVITAITYDASGNWACYLNGSPDGSGTNNQVFVASLLQIGRQQAGQLYFDGSMQSIAIYNIALTAPQVASLTTAMNAL